ncbi:MAG: methionine synthase, partial [Planctomycetaceae bacterium]|nr:methionine synthase [Planctomycetaceae bacterium]
MNDSLKEILSHGIQVLDGAWGTQFQQKGLPLGQSPDLWNLEQPEKVLEVAQSYVKAGSDIIITNTFGCSVLTLKKSGMESKVHELNEAGVRLSKQAAGERVKVFASMGPTGYLLMMGEVTEDEMFESFRLQAEGMKAGGADGIVVETM